MLAKRSLPAKNQRAVFQSRKLRKMSHSVEKNQKGTLQSPLYFHKYKNFGLVQYLNPRTSTFQTSESPG